MKSRFVIRLLAVLVVFYSCQESKAQKNDWQREGLKGRVKEAKDVIYTVRDKSGKISSRDIALDYTKVFDGNGNLIELVIHNRNWDTVKTNIRNKFDEKGNRVEKSSYVLDTILMDRYEYKFDDKGNDVEWEAYNNLGAMYRKGICKYDNKGKKIEESVYDSKNTFINSSVFRYDESGNIVEEDSYVESNKLINTTTNKYEFDSKGNWITQKVYIPQFKNPRNITKREIVYY